MRAVIYARYSTELQNKRSIDDQIALCRRYAGREKLEIVGTFHDAAISGATIANRDGLKRLLLGAQTRAFDVVIAEALDRISRDNGDLSYIFRVLRFNSVEIWTVDDGRANTLNIGVRGLFGQMQLEGTTDKIRRGLSGRVKQGLSPGGATYGYRPKPGEKGKLLVQDDEAAVVRRIFASYVAGLSPRQIAKQLNGEAVPAPRGIKWNASTIHGSSARGTGILNNQLYDGRIVWNKVRMVRNPENGLRVSRPNATNDHEAVEVPQYRILPEGQFQQAQALKRHRTTGERPEHYRRPKRILSGLLRCEACGSGMTVCGTDRSGRVRIRCSVARESGTCPDPKTFYLEDVEHLVVHAVLAELKQPRRLRLFVETYLEERQRLAFEANKGKALLERQIAQKQREIDRLVQAIAKGEVSSAIAGPLANAAGSERDELARKLEELPTMANPIALHPLALKRYEENLGGVLAELQRGLDNGQGEGASAMRELLETVVVGRSDTGTLRVEITGKLNALVGAPGFGTTRVVNDGSGGGI